MSNETSIRYIKMNEEIQISLNERASTGYVWELKSKDNFTLTKRLVINQNVAFEAPGSSSEYCFCFMPKRPGEHILRLEMVRPWERQAPPVEVYEETIFVSE